jgi:hypothetical protein
LPGWYSVVSGIAYANEVTGMAFGVGALAIVAANVLIALQAKPEVAPPGGVL